MDSERFRGLRIALMQRSRASEDTFLLVTAILVGVGTGVGTIIVRSLIEIFTWFSFEWLPHLTRDFGKAFVVVVPTLGGLVVGILVYKYAREAKGHGVPEVMEAIALRGGRIRPVVAVIKSLASALTIGSGGSAGSEGPIVQIGASLGSTLGQALRLSDDRIRNLVACGAAGGIAATFNTPIAGVIFALEVILGAFSVRYFSTVVISAVVASVIGRAVYGDLPTFPLPVEYGVKSLWEYAFYPVLGILAALVGVVFVRSLYFFEDAFDGWQGFPEWAKPAVGGTMLGLMALLYPGISGLDWDVMPQVFGSGYEIIAGALNNELILSTVLTLLLLKIAATSFTLGSGGSGGVFAPALFMGAMLGTAFEIVLRQFFPDIVAPPGAYALVGMAAVFAASAHAPITAIIILGELTNDQRIVLPLMLAVIVATLVSRRLMHGQSIYTLKLTRRGVNIEHGRDVDIMQGVLVKEVMASNVEVVPGGMTIAELSDVFDFSHSHGFPILDEQQRLWGIVTVSDLDRARAKELPADTSLTVIATRRENLHIAYPDETIGDVLMRLGVRGLGRMPVVARENPYHLLGMVRRVDIISAYNLAVTRRSEIKNQTDYIKTFSSDGTQFVEFTVTRDSFVVGRRVQDIAGILPEKCILVSISRRGQVLIPHGGTTFGPGDKVTAFVSSSESQAFAQSMTHGQPPVGSA